jgi:hypothetical protein
MVPAILASSKSTASAVDSGIPRIWEDTPNTHNLRDYSGRGNGWGASRLIDGSLAYQRPDGLFHDVIDLPDTFIEANLAQLLAIAIYTGILGGGLPGHYLPAADRMRTAARAKMDPHGCVQSVCGAPNFDSPGTSTEARAFAIMMEASSAKPPTR